MNVYSLTVAGGTLIAGMAIRYGNTVFVIGRMLCNGTATAMNTYFQVPNEIKPNTDQNLVFGRVGTTSITDAIVPSFRGYINTNGQIYQGQTNPENGSSFEICGVYTLD